MKLRYSRNEMEYDEIEANIALAFGSSSHQW